MIQALMIKSASDVVVAPSAESNHPGSGCKLTAGDVEACCQSHRAAGRHVRAIMISSPTNMAQNGMSRAEAVALVEVLEAEMDTHGPEEAFLVLVQLDYAGAARHAYTSLLLEASERLKKRICLLFTASKGMGDTAEAHTSWLSVGDCRLVPEMHKVQQTCMSGFVGSASQVRLEGTLNHLMESTNAKHLLKESSTVANHLVEDAPAKRQRVQGLDKHVELFSQAMQTPDKKIETTCDSQTMSKCVVASPANWQDFVKQFKKQNTILKSDS